MKKLPRVDAKIFQIADKPFFRGTICDLFEARVLISNNLFKNETEYVIKRIRKTIDKGEGEHYINNLDMLITALGAFPHRLMHLNSRLAMPIAIIRNSLHEEIGYVMEKISKGATCTIRTIDGTRSRLQDFRLFMNSPRERAEFRTPVLSRRVLLNIIDDMFRTLNYLHEAGVVVGDISATNLVLMTKPNANVKKRCIFLDFDSFTIAGAPHPLGNQWSNGYVAPEQVNNSSYIHTQESDIYKIAIVAIRMLTQTCDYPSYSFGIETVDPSRQALLFLGGHKLYEFMDRALSDNPLLRPTSEVLSSTWTNYLTLRKLKI